MSFKGKLAVFVESYPHVVAGQQRTMLSLLETAPQCGLHPLLLVPGDGAYCDLIRERGVEIVSVPYPEEMSRYGGAIYRDRLRARLATLKAWWGYIGSCRRTLRRLEPGVIFCNDMRGLLTVGLAARTLGIPVMIWDKLDKPHGILDWLQLPIASRNAVISKSVTAKYPRIQRWCYRNKIELVPNGADLQKFHRGESRRSELGIDSDCVVIGIVGTVTHRKGHDRLLGIVPQLAESHTKVKILVIGSWQDSDEDQQYYQTLEHKDHPIVTFLGQRDDVVDLMHTIDILAIPSRHEGMGQVTVEAMAAGKPVVGANAGGIPEVVADGQTGFIFDGDDRDAFLDCLSRLTRSLELREQMGRAGRDRCEKLFNRPMQITKICEILGSLIEKTNRVGN